MRTAAEEERGPVRVGELDHRARRLLKTWQEADLVRRMDAAISASHGAYADRTEFIAEALRDRIEAEEERLGIAPGGRPAVRGAGDATLPEIDLTIIADWVDGDPPTLSRAEGPETNFGLHNRDFPTLWAADWLGRLTTRAGSPISWRDFVAAITPRAWQYGRVLAERDLDRPPGVKLAAGFPTNIKKREGAESRFRAHAVGVPSERGHQGPMFVFGLVGLVGEDEDAATALTTDGVALLTRLAEVGIAQGPPFGPAAWKVFGSYLETHAAAELATWRMVLERLADGPDRATLVRRCDWWTGSTADTNAMSYVARAREWGLVEPRLRDGRYALTELGRSTVRAEVI